VPLLRSLGHERGLPVLDPSHPADCPRVTCLTCGAAFGVLRTRYRLIVALLVTNIWFAAMHLDSQVLGFFLFGVVLTLPLRSS
jgi:hypothetical protein